MLSNCEAIWGKGDYGVDVETDDWEYYQGVVVEYMDHGNDPKTMTGLFRSSEQVWDALDQELSARVRQKSTRKPMREDQTSNTFGGPNAQNTAIPERSVVEQQKRVTGATSATRKDEKMPYFQRFLTAIQLTSSAAAICKKSTSK
jgi:hypothetical protein